MRRVTYGGACSLDGFLAGPNNEIDWLHFSPDVSRIIEEYWKGVDAILMGRKTWEVAQGQNAVGAATMPTYVFSRTLTRIDQPGVELVREDATGFVSKLKKQKGKDICLLGGGDLARSLFEAGLIDEVGMNIHPILLGSGVPAFLETRERIGLELRECRQLQGGCVYVVYGAKPKRGSRRQAKG